MKSITPLEYALEGPPTGRPLVFVHGWPDEPRLWRKQIDFFKSTYPSAAVRLPAFGNNDRGEDFPELVERLKRAIEDLKAKPVRRKSFWSATIGAPIFPIFSNRSIPNSSKP